MTERYLNNIQIPFELNGRTFNLIPYRTYQEKDLLLMKSYFIEDLTKYLELLNFKDHSGLTENELIVILWKIRELSLGAGVLTRFKCLKCSQVNEHYIEAVDMVTDSKKIPGIKQLSEELTDSNLFKFVDLSQDELDEMDLIEYGELFKLVKKSQVKYNFKKVTKCAACSQKASIDFGDKDFLINALTDEDLPNMYRTYTQLIYIGHFTKADVDYMYAFERTIFLNVLNNVKESTTG